MWNWKGRALSERVGGRGAASAKTKPYKYERNMRVEPLWGKHVSKGLQYSTFIVIYFFFLQNTNFVWRMFKLLIKQILFIMWILSTSNILRNKHNLLFLETRKNNPLFELFSIFLLICVNVVIIPWGEKYFLLRGQKHPPRPLVN